MLGAIIGDVVGSIYEVKEVEAIKNSIDKKRSYEERIKILDKNIPLLTNECSYTDDTVLTVAIADAILNKRNYETCLKEYGLKELNLGLDLYGRSRFGSGFVNWLQSDEIGQSYGNGSAMRISPVGYLFNNEDDIKENVLKATIPSHNNNEAILGAESVAITIYLIRKGYTKDEIKEYIETNYYKLNFNLEDLQKNYRFSSRCSKSVPQSLFCFLESNSFEDAIRKSISIGGDSDTIASIVGTLSEAYYGIPKYLKEKINYYIPEQFQCIINEFYLKKEFLDFMNKEELFTNDFYKYIECRTKVINRPINEDWYGCFPIIKNNILTDIRVLVPKIIDRKTLLVNIHEYNHAMELYKELGKNYNENIEMQEENAIKLEKKFKGEKNDI